MVGEIRDAETAKIAIEASLTGHLVLSTLHTNNASESVVRLLDLGMDPMNFADSLLGLVAQRLARKLCTHCASERPLDAEGWEDLLQEYMEDSDLSRPQAQARLLEAAGVTSPDQSPHPACRGLPALWRQGLQRAHRCVRNPGEQPCHQELIQKRARPSEIFSVAVSEGMRSLRHDALEKVVQGVIDLKQARSAYR